MINNLFSSGQGSTERSPRLGEGIRRQVKHLQYFLCSKAVITQVIQNCLLLIISPNYILIHKTGFRRAGNIYIYVIYIILYYIIIIYYIYIYIIYMYTCVTYFIAYIIKEVISFRGLVILNVNECTCMLELRQTRKKTIAYRNCNI